MTTEIIAGRENGVAEKMRSKAQAAKVDLIIVGDKGRNTFSSLLVGSVTEELLTLMICYGFKNRNLIVKRSVSFEG
jgi:nucleotide-binding universal stress UspA family protein